MAKLLLIELNEINFDFVASYVRQGKLPVLQRLIGDHGVQYTTSEQRYEELEPWIQWVTAHTGLSLSQHRVFRLGDIVEQDLSQIWERLEADGFRVGAISPMNAKNRTRAASFFVPDPWTRTAVTGSRFLRRLHRAVCEAVSENAEAKMSLGTATVLLAGLMVYARPTNYGLYGKFVLGARSKRWLRALLLDLLLSDIFIRLTRNKRPDFASLFVNAGAHIQHHYMFSSAAYRGRARNPDWYLRSGEDPVLDAYEIYDRMIGHVLAVLPDYRLMIATGLRQEPHEQTTFYWRLRDHGGFLSKVGVRFAGVEPRMSRDFVVRFDSDADAVRADAILQSARAPDGTPLFEVDYRGRSLFVMLTFPHDIDADFQFTIDEKRYSGLKGDVVFVAIKNGEHNGLGSFLDTGHRAGQGTSQFELKELPARVQDAIRTR